MVSPTVDRRLGLVGNIPMKAPVTVLAATNITQSGQQTIDGVAVLAINAAGVADRVLVTGQTVSSQNGIYDVSLNAWSRSVDANGPYDLTTGTQVLVGGGTLNIRTVWCLTTVSPITIGTSALTWQLAVGASLGTFLQSGAGAVARTFTDKVREWVSITDFGAVANDATKGAVNYAACVAAAVLGKNIFIPAGLYYMSQRWDITDRNIVGEGSGVFSTDTISRLHFPAGSGGLKLTGQGTCRVSSLSITSASGSATTGDGIWINAHGCVLDGVLVQAMGAHGVHIDSTGSNSNCCSLRRVRALFNFGDGFHVGTSADANACTLDTCDASGNTGYGFYSDAANTLFLHPHAASNTAGDYYEHSGSNIYLLPYSEGGTMTFGAGTAGNLVIYGNFGQPTFLGDTAQNTVMGASPTAVGGVAGLVLLNQVAAGQIPWASTAAALRGSASLGFDGITFNAPNVKFPAAFANSLDPNTLDDYEEGTFTPTDTSGAGLVFTAVSAKYTKIGREVFAKIDLTFPATADGSAVKIGGLPFAAVGSTPVGGAFVRYTDAGRTDLFRMSVGATELLVTNNAGVAPANSAYSGKTIQLAVSYIAA
jgi:hypothetical protein